MTTSRTIDSAFNQADINHDGRIDEREFRSFLGPTTDTRRLSGTLTQRDVQAINAQAAAGGVTSVSYPVGLDVAVGGFQEKNPIEYEKYTSGAGSEHHTYGVGPDVAVGAPNIAPKVHQYDAAGSMFEYADVNHDGGIDRQEFGSFMRSV